MNASDPVYLPREALRARDRGDTYRAIAESLQISPAQVHRVGDEGWNCEKRTLMRSRAPSACRSRPLRWNRTRSQPI